MTVTKSLQERIRELEKQKAELVLRRKDEIFEVINANGGTCLDNRLLAGFASYASMEENKDDVFLKKLKDIGAKMRFPRRRKESVAKRANKNK
jgi:hypothetical protein